MMKVRDMDRGVVRKPVVRQQARPLVVRKPNKVDVWINGAFIFVQRLGLQLSKTLLATALASLADFVRTRSDKETSSILNKHGGMKDPNEKTENQRNLYGHPCQTENRGYYSGQYGSEYGQRKTSGTDSFPGFGN